MCLFVCLLSLFVKRQKKIHKLFLLYRLSLAPIFNTSFFQLLSKLYNTHFYLKRKLSISNFLLEGYFNVFFTIFLNFQYVEQIIFCSLRVRDRRAYSFIYSTPLQSLSLLNNFLCITAYISALLSLTIIFDKKNIKINT